MRRFIITSFKNKFVELPDLERKIIEDIKADTKEIEIIEPNFKELTFVFNFAENLFKTEKIGEKPKSDQIYKKGRENQEFLLLEEVLNRNEAIHWTLGFVIFNNWDMKIPVNAPVEQFRKIVVNLNTKLNTRIFEPKKDKGRCWELSKNINIVSEIKKAEDMVNEALKSENSKLIIERFQKAYSCYSRSINICKLLIDYSTENFEIIDRGDELDTQLKEAKFLLFQRKKMFEDALKNIQIRGKKNKWEGDWEEAGRYVYKMSKELHELKKYCIMAEGLNKNKPIGYNEATCLALIKTINGIREDQKNRENLFNEILQREEINDCRNKSSNKFKIWFEKYKGDSVDYEECQGRAENVLNSVG